MNWDWYDLDKAAGDRRGVSEREKQKSRQKLSERQALERELQNVTGNRNAVFDIKGRATNEKIRAKIEEEKRLNREAQIKARKDAIRQGKDKAIAGTKAGAKAGAKAVQDATTATARGIGQAGAKYIDRGLGGDKPKATTAQQEAMFQELKRRAERAKQPIDYKAIEERRKRAFKDGRDPNLYYNKKGQPVAPVAQAAKDAGKAIAGKTVAAGKKAIGAGAKAVAAPFKSAGRVASHLFRGGNRISSTHASREYDSQGRKNPIFKPEAKRRKELEAQKNNPKTVTKPKETKPVPPPAPAPTTKKPLSDNVKEQLKKPDSTTKPKKPLAPAARAKMEQQLENIKRNEPDKVALIAQYEQMLNR